MSADQSFLPRKEGPADSMETINAFAGNPLIPGKKDHMSSEALVSMLAEAEKHGLAGGMVLPVLDGKPLISTTKDSTGCVGWSLAWQTVEAAGFRSPTEVAVLTNQSDPDSLSPHQGAEYDQLVYLGEQENVPYFALEVAPMLPHSETEKTQTEAKKDGKRTPLDPKLMRSLSERFRPQSDGSKMAFVDLRTVMVATDWSNPEDMEKLAVAGHARALLEWHKQVPFCGRCGRATAPVEAGNRRRCSLCRSKAYPRTDPVVIMLVIDQERDRVVLGRQARFAPRMWSCLAGFMEPGESLEEAVRRETREEVGLEVGEVVYHSSQPWPVGFGNMSCQLMVGFFAFAKTFDMVVDKKELQDAQWHTRQQVKEALSFPEYRENQQAALSKLYTICHEGDDDPGWAPKDSGKPRPPTYVPGPYAIAHHLINTWAELGAQGLADANPRGTQGILSKV